MQTESLQEGMQARSTDEGAGLHSNFPLPAQLEVCPSSLKPMIPAVEHFSILAWTSAFFREPVEAQILPFLTY